MKRSRATLSIAKLNWNQDKMNLTVSLSWDFSLFRRVLTNFRCAEKIQKLLLIREEFDKFIETTENS